MVSLIGYNLDLKYKRYHRKMLTKTEYKENVIFLKHGCYGIKALESGLVNVMQIEAVRRIIARKTKKNGKIWINCYPVFPVTSKPKDSRMGKGKGNIKNWVFPIKAGFILFEISGLSFNVSYSLLRAASKKLNIKCKVVKRFH